MIKKYVFLIPIFLLFFLSINIQAQNDNRAVATDTLRVSVNADGEEEHGESAIFTVNGEIVCEDDFETLTKPPETYIPENQKLSPTSDFRADPKSEILDKRDRTSKHYLREDGTAIDAIISPTSVHYLDKSNNWQDIETGIKSSDKKGYVYANTTNNLKSYFSADPSADGILIETERANLFTGRNLKMNWHDSTGIILSSVSSKASYPKIQSNTIDYKNIFPNVDNQFVVENDKLKHNYILQQRPNIPKGAEHLSFSEEIQLPANWKMDFDQNQSGLIIIDEANTVYLQIPFPVVYEKDNQLRGIAEDTLSGYDLKSLGNGKYKVSTMVSAKWLDASSYPIVVDPQIVLNGNYSGYIWYDYNRSWRSGSSYCGSNYNNVNYYFNAYNSYSARVTRIRDNNTSYSSSCYAYSYSCNPYCCGFLCWSTCYNTCYYYDYYNYGYRDYDAYKGWIRYNTSAIPDGATINSVGFRGVVSSGSSQNESTYIYSASAPGSYPSSSSSYYYNQITSYYHGAAVYSSPGYYPVANLNASARSRLQSLLPQNYFQIGLYVSSTSYSSAINLKYFNTAQSTLHVTYTVPCTNIVEAPEDPFPYHTGTNVCYDGGGAVTALAWSTVPEASSYDVYFGTSATPGLFQANLPSTFTTANLNLAANTQYYWKVVPKNDCSTFANVSTWNFTTAGAACSNEGCTFDFDFVSPITKVTFANIDNPSSASTSSPSYENFTPISTTVSEGSTQSLRVEANTGTTGSVAERTLYVNAFFDWNQDGDFTDAGESYYVGQIYNSTGLDGNYAQNTGINIPNSGNNVLLGDITMRVIASRYNNTDPCESDPDNTDSTYGQTEDYTVNLCGLPVASCQNITVILDEFGIASIEAADVDNGSTAPCGLLSMEISQTIFNCSHVGTQEVELTITDEFGNVATCFATVTVVDNEIPTIECPPDILVSNDPGECGAVVTFEDPVASDNCGDGEGVPLEFTNAGATGRMGPTQSQINTAYTGTALDGAVTINSQGIQEWVVPASGLYTLQALGAQGGRGSNNAGGLGAEMSGEFFLSQGEVIKILVGQKGIDNAGSSVNDGGPGGGGTFIVRSDNSILLIAGGGGGGNGIIGGNAGINPSGSNGSGNPAAFGGINGGGGGAALYGTAGNGAIPGGIGQSCSYGSGGGGFYSDGGKNCSGTRVPFTNGIAFINGGLGGNADTALGGTEGGFGGGAGTGHRAGGGGGYSGGGGSVSQFGGGGGSFNDGDDQTNIAGVNEGMGVVRITPLDVSTLTIAQTDATGLSSGSTFPVGITTLEYTATDASGNTATCSFTVTVEDNEDPVITCVASANRDTDPDVCTYTIVGTEFDATFTDNCPDGSITNDLNGSDSIAGEILSEGATTVVWTVDDGNGQTDTCITTITVIDKEDPVVSCPSDITVSNDFGECGAIVTFSPSISDNCPGSSLTASPASGTFFAVGTTQVTVTGVDASNNEVQCTFNVTVNDTEAPGGGTQFPAPDLALINVPEEASNYSLVYELNIPNNSNWATNGQVPYTVNNSAALTNIPFTRVAYMMELENNNDPNTKQWVWVSFDEITQDYNEIGIPADYVKQQAVSNMNVFASANAGVTTGTEIATGNVEFWSNCYGGGAGNPNIPQGNNGLYDFNDSGPPNSPDCYGSFQIHNYDEGETLFAFNSWSNAGLNEAGIGNQIGGSGHPDWTFAHNSGSYTTKNIYVLTLNSSVVCNDVTLTLDTAGNATLDLAQVNSGVSDNCGVDTTVLSKTSFNCTDLGENTVTLTITDIHGNVSTCTSTVTVIDTTDPIITVGASNRTVECDGNGNTTALNGWLSSNGDGGAATDNCDNITWSNDFTALSNGCGETGSATVTFTATDPSGNSVNTIATFTIEDTTSPSLSGVPSDITVECDAIPTAANPTASDTCDANPDIAFNEFKQYCQFADAYFAGASDWTDLDGDGFGEFIRYNDNNTNNGGSFIGSSGQIDSSGSSWGLWANGDTSNIVRFFDTPMSSGDTFSILMDNGSINNGGTVGFALQNASAGNLLEFYFIGGQSNYYLNSLGGQTDTGIPFTDQGLSLSFTLVSATDVIVEITQLASNMVSTYNLEVLNPGDQTIGKIRMFNANAGGGNDQFFNNIKHCIETNTVPDGGCASNYTLARTWTATDECNNTFAQTQIITVEDKTPPTITADPSDLTVECDGAGNTAQVDAWLASIGNTGAASDVCGGVVWTNNYTGLSDECGATGSALVTFTATDDCGNTSTTQATFTIEDITAPSIDTAASDETVECDGTADPAGAFAAWLASNGGAVASDVCGSVTWSNNSAGLSDDCGATGTETVTFTATDACGNSTPTTATFTIEDTTVPSIDVDATDETVECDGAGNTAQVDAWLASIGNTGAASDVCGGVVWTNNYTGLSDECGATGSALVTFTATDDCGNTSTTQATFTIEDITAPSIDTAASDETVECDGTADPAGAFAAWLASNGGAVASDVCGSVTWSNNSAGLSDDCGATGTETVTFTATDACGNSTPTTATFTIEDTTVPSIDVDATDETVECDGAGNTAQVDAWLASIGNTGAASDVCGGVVWTNNYTGLSDECGATGSALVTFTATDDCGNTSTTQATFTIEDITAPSIDTAASDETVECDGTADPAGAFAAWLASNGGAVASDVCGSVTWSNNSAGLSDDCGATGTETVTFTATDACGNSTPTTATFTIEDTTVPSIDVDATDETVECDGAGNTAQVDAWLASIGNTGAASDVCGGVVWTNNYTGLSDECGATGSALVTFTATDDCGNTSTTTATFTIEDTTDPDITCPADVTINCEDDTSVAANGTATGSDTCSAVVITSTDVSTQVMNDLDLGYYNYTITRTWRATDDCGNFTECDQLIMVEDVTPPVVDCVGLTLLLDEFGNGSITAEDLNNNSVDNCSPVFLSISQTNFDCTDIGGDLDELIISEYIDGSEGLVDSNIDGSLDINKWVEIYNGTGNEVILSEGFTSFYSLKIYTDGSAIPVTIGLLGSIPDGAVYKIAHTAAAGSNINFGSPLVYFDGNDAIGLAHDNVIVDYIPAASWIDDVRLIRMNDVFNGNPAGNQTEWNSDGPDIFTDLGLHDIETTGLANNVILTVTDVSGNSSTCEANVTVVDNTAPIALCQNLTVQLDEDGNATILPQEIDNGSNDACGIASLVLDVTTFDCDVVGTNTVTLTVTDNNDNVSTCTATVTVEDNVPPVAICQDITVQLDANGDASITVDDIDNGSNDACGIASRTIDVSTFDCSNVGPNTVTLTVTDVNDNVSTCTATVTIEDNVPPVVVCNDITKPLPEAGANSTYTLTAADIDAIALGSTDNCGIATKTVSPDTFTCDNEGVNVVTLTVTDVNGNVSTCDATVTITGLVPVLTITEGPLPEFCQGAVVVLTVESSVPVESYLWTTNEDTQSIEVGGNGTYGVTVTSITGCVEYLEYEVTGFDATALISAYTIIAENEVFLHGSNLVESGGVGVSAANGLIKLHQASNIVGFGKATNITLNQGSTIGNPINAPAGPIIPAFQFNTYSNAGSPDATINNNQSVTLNGSVYDEIVVKKDATVTFTQPNVYINDLKTFDGASIEFTQCTNVYINEKFMLAQNGKINYAGGQNVVIYVNEDVQIEKGSYVRARLHSNGNELLAKGGNANGNNAPEPTQMIGLFICKKVHGNTNVVWNADPLCDPCPAEAPNNPPPSIENSDSTFKVKAWPNPAETVFNLKVLSTNSEAMISISVYDMSNKLVLEDTFNLNDEYKFGEKLDSGVYIVKIAQGDQMDVLRLIKNAQ